MDVTFTSVVLFSSQLPCSILYLDLSKFDKHRFQLASYKPPTRFCKKLVVVVVVVVDSIWPSNVFSRWLPIPTWFPPTPNQRVFQPPLGPRSNPWPSRSCLSAAPPPRSCRIQAGPVIDRWPLIRWRSELGSEWQEQQQHHTTTTTMLKLSVPTSFFLWKVVKHSPSQVLWPFGGVFSNFLLCLHLKSVSIWCFLAVASYLKVWHFGDFFLRLMFKNLFESRCAVTRLEGKGG